MRDPLVLVPGLDDTGLLFHRQVPRIERRFAVTTVRLRDDAARMTELVDDLHRAVEAAAPDGGPVTLIGGSTICGRACRNLPRPCYSSRPIATRSFRRSRRLG